MLWGGRFEKELNKKALEFSSSINFDIRLYAEDIQGSRAHAEMLGKIGILSESELTDILAGLRKIKEEIESGSWNPREGGYEDIHSAVEDRLFHHAGETAGKLHTGRSRNDQIATDTRLWLKKAVVQLRNSVNTLQKTLVKTAEQHTETLMPGYTHLQRAQPVSLAFHLLAYVEMLERAKERLAFVFNQTNRSPLGCGALAGSTLPLDRNFTAEKLGFASVTNNALDSISDRDYILDFLHACNLGMMTLSRFAEELILWSTFEWNFVKFDDAYSTGSSLMPQKKNPDIAELTRGKTGRVYGNYINLLTQLRGLPLSYNRDLQEDKEPMFDSFDTLSAALEMTAGMIATVKFDTERFASEMEGDFSLATDLADWLVLKGIPFRKAHEITGAVVKFAEQNGKKLNQLSLGALKSIAEIFDESALEIFSVENALLRKKTFGSPNPELVKSQIDEWMEKLSSKNSD